MSRIDDALRRLSGTPAESRSSSGLERFASEGKAPRGDEPRRPHAVDEHKVAAFVSAGPHAVERVESRVAEPRAIAHKPVIVPPAAAAPVEPPPAAPEPAADPNAEGEGGNLFDIRQIADYVGFVFRAIGRHKLLAGATFSLLLALTALVVVFVPRTYYVEVKLL